MSLPAPFPTARIAQTVGIGLSWFLAGKTYHAAIMARIFRDAPSVESGKRWREMAKEAMATSPTLTVLSSAAFAYLAYVAPERTTRRLYTAAALLVPSFIPSTFCFMLPSYAALQDVASERIKDEARIRGAFASWARLNGLRAWLIACGAYVGMWAALW